jgi:phosphoribosylanthranilate isomerase
LNLKPHVKICGITNREQAIAISEMGADFIGINFWPKSKRYLPIEKAAGWLADIPLATRVVGVFVNADESYLKEAASIPRLEFLQLHGDETPEDCANLKGLRPRVIKAFQVRDETALDAIASYDVSDILLDAYHPTERGGVGATFPWELALSFKRKYPQRSLWLAGGLVPDNVAEAVASTQPFAVDVASGVEDEQPGIKNLAKVLAFIRAAHPMKT